MDALSSAPALETSLNKSDDIAQLGLKGVNTLNYQDISAQRDLQALLARWPLLADFAQLQASGKHRA